MELQNTSFLKSCPQSTCGDFKITLFIRFAPLFVTNDLVANK